MGRHKTPTNIMELRNAFKTHPERKRTKEPPGNPSFDNTPPEYFSEAQIKCWNDVISMVPAGVLTASDAAQVEITAGLLSEYREKKGALEISRITRLCALFGQLGLNPSGRAGLEIEPPRKNKFDD